jgi:hypothetical protein
MANDLAGVMIWELGADDKQHTLLNSLSNRWEYPVPLFDRPESHGEQVCRDYQRARR